MTGLTGIDGLSLLAILGGLVLLLIGLGNLIAGRR
jgi:hypothetical protein